ncbi:MAG TPA: DUF2298 domain-containing protein [Gemmatimonadaceae bacterium]|jgi:uncharacterized membrane protein|nr:DUF2298 domain-containing protein [Gemmatimonadaceae bacterium]
MLAHLATAFVIAVIYTNLVALALLGHRYTRHYALSRVATPIAAALLLFFVEHFVGLGALSWSWPILTAGSLWIASRHLAVLRARWKVEAAFLASFAWVFAWRWSAPSMVASSEKIGDLAMISSYLPGSRLPPQDAWFPPYPFDVYYSFQHYAAALLGRIFGLGPGLTYNLAFCIAVSLTITAAAAATYVVCRSVPRTILVTVAFAAGGTGATIAAWLMTPHPQLYSSMRFIGDFAKRAPDQTPFARWLLSRAGTGMGVPAEQAIKLPAETFAYVSALGDYHPMLSGFYLLALALLCIALLESDAESRAAQTVLVATVPVCAIANGWSLPLQGMLVAAWVAYRLTSRRPLDWRSLAGALGATALCYPFLSTFAYRASDYDVHLRFVAAGEHTPVLLGAIVLAPLLVALVLPLAFGERKPWMLWATLLFAALLLISELFFIDDVYGGPFNRFNTTLKWWPWIQAGALLTLGAYGIRSRSRALRWGTIAVLAWVSLYGVDLGRALLTGPKPGHGQLDGAAEITADPIERIVLAYLQTQPRTIVLQRPQAGAFTPAPSLVLLAGQTAFLGWAEHERLWRGMRADVGMRAAEVKRFYAGEMDNAAEWLVQNRIDHVLWLKTEAELPAGTFDRVDARVRAEFYWRELYRVGEFRVGVWSRRRR